MLPACTPLRRARRASLLIVGCGDVGTRVLGLLAQRCRVVVLTSSVARVPALRAAGAVPLIGDLEDPATLGRLGALAGRVLHLAPPPAAGVRDPRTAHLLHALSRGGTTRTLVYGSTTGVYGDCGGARIDETRAVAPASARARRRVDAEAQLRFFGRMSRSTCTVLRIPGIYALDRAGGDPRERVRNGRAVLAHEDDVFTNHIHADDLARACLRALFLARPQRVINVCDDSDERVGDYYDRVADLCGLPRLPRMSRAQAREHFSPMQWSFMSESRRIGHARMSAELRLELRYPTVETALARTSPEALNAGA